MAAEQYDAIVIGSGQGGNPLAEALATAGRKTALIERKHLGGTCINDGCTPTKTMVASARVAYLAGRGSEYGVGLPGTAPLQMQMKVVRQRKRAIVDDFRGAKEKRLGSAKNLELIWGEASFVAPRTLDVKLRDGGTRTVSAEQIFINTGTRPTVPKLDGLDKVSFLDNVSIMELDAVPAHLMILGGGYIGVEFAQMFRRFGAQVSIVHAGAHLLDHEDADIAEEVQKIFAEDGITLHLDARATRAAQTADGIALTLSKGSGEETIRGSHLLVAVGRTPNTSELNLPAAGIAVDERGFIRSNERLETSAAGVFVIGDVKGGPAFTHISYDDFRILRANILEGKSKTTAGRMVPYTVFMDPELGRIGVTEAEARRDGRKVRIARMRMTSVARALETAETRGVMKVVIDADGERILGAAILGIAGGEIASMLQLAMMGGLSVSTLRDGVFSHPTLAESLNNLFLNIE